MPLNPGDILFVGWDADNEDIAFIATVDLAPGTVIWFSDDEWNGTAFDGSEQLFSWTVPVGGVDAGTVVEIDMNPAANTVTFTAGGAVNYLKGGHQLAVSNEMFWAFEGTQSGNTVTPTNFIGVIGNEADGTYRQTPELSGTGLTTSNGAIIIDGDEDHMEYTADAVLPAPVDRATLIASVSDLNNWTTADGVGNNNPHGTGFDFDFPTVVCFGSGTLIETPGGPKRIEHLSAGDMIMTRDHGAQPLRWIGGRSVPAQGKLAPIRIIKGALGNSKTLTLSPQHRVLIKDWRASFYFGEEEVFVPAVSLVNGSTVLQLPGGSVTYWHMLFDRHEIVVSNGTLTESFFPGEAALNALQSSARDEVLDIFPELAQLNSGASTTMRATARPSMRAHDARALAA